MRKFVYVCLLLPNLSLNAFAKEKELTAKKTIEMKSASIVKADKETCVGVFHDGSCYVFDEDEPVMVLRNVRYSPNAKDELIVDLHLDAKDQEKFQAMTKKMASKRHLVMSINGKVVSTPLVRTEITGPDLQVSLNNKTEAAALLSVLAAH